MCLDYMALQFAEAVNDQEQCFWGNNLQLIISSHTDIIYGNVMRLINQTLWEGKKKVK